MNKDLDTYKIVRHRIGQQLAKIREAEGLSREDLAEKAGVTVGTVAKVEEGRFSAGIDLLGRLASVLGYTLTVESL